MLLDYNRVGKTCLERFHRCPVVHIFVSGDEGIDACAEFCFFSFVIAEEFVVPFFLDGVVFYRVVADAGFVGGDADGGVEASKCIDKADLESVGTRPDATACDAVDEVNLQVESGGHTTDECLVEILDIALHHGACVGRERAHHAEARAVAVGSDGVGGDAEFVTEEVANFGDGAEDTDGAGDGGGLSHDAVGVAGNHIAGRGGHTTH